MDPLQGSGVVLIDEIELHLHPKDDGDKQAAARTTIAKLALDISELTKQRRAAIDAVLQVMQGLSDTEIQQLAEGFLQKDAQGRFTPFCEVITYIVKQYF